MAMLCDVIVSFVHLTVLVTKYLEGTFHFLELRLDFVLDYGNDSLVDVDLANVLFHLIKVIQR